MPEVLPGSIASSERPTNYLSLASSAPSMHGTSATRGLGDAAQLPYGRGCFTAPSGRQLSLPKQIMRKSKIHQTRATGILPAILLFCVASIAILCGPLANGTSWTQSQSSAAMDSVDILDRHNAPDFPRRLFVVVDSRSVKALAVHDDDKSKGALVPTDVGLAAPYLAAQSSAIHLRMVSPGAPHGYKTRAPPRIV